MFGEDTFGLLDGDPAVQGALQLGQQDLPAPTELDLDQPDGGDIDHRLADVDVGLAQGAGLGVEEVQCPDGLRA